MLLEKIRNNYRNKKSLAFVLTFIVMISMLTMGAISDMEAKSVTLVQKDVFNDIENRREIITKKTTVEEFLTEQGVVLNDDDILNVSLSDELQTDDIITVEKSRLIQINIDGQTSFERTKEKTVEEALKAAGVELSEYDIVSPERRFVVTHNMSITVTKVEVVEEVVEADIPYNTVKQNDSAVYVGKTFVKRYGVNGSKREVYKVTKSDGNEISRELISTEVIKEPVDEILLIGTKQNQNVVNKKQSLANSNSEFRNSADKIEQSDKGFSYSKVYNVTATAYDPSPESNAGYTKTAYGLTPEYGVVAVDPKVIPLGTRLYIESSDGGASWVYGYCIAGDTGGAIKGLKVDLCYNTKQECMQFGRRSATVYVLD